MCCRKTVKCGFSDLFDKKNFSMAGVFCAVIKVSVSLQNLWAYIFFLNHCKKLFFFFDLCLYSTLVSVKSWFS